jgi:hypothetical protein
VESFLNGLGREGFSNAACVEAHRAFTRHLLLEVSALGADLGPLDVVEEEADKALAPYPVVRQLRGPLREDQSATEFEDSLERGPSGRRVPLPGSVVLGRLVPSGAVSSDAYHEAGRLHREAQPACLGEHVTVDLAQLWWVDSHCEVTAPVTLERGPVAPVGQHP